MQSEPLLDDLDRHLDAAGSLARASVPPGMYFAWCTNLGLVSEPFVQAHETEVVRVRMRDLTPAEFFVLTTGGRIRPGDLGSEGRTFTENYYEHFLDEMQSALGGDPYAVADTWVQYDRIAPVLTRRLQDWRRTGHSATGRRWWRFWRR